MDAFRAMLHELVAAEEVAEEAMDRTESSAAAAEAMDVDAAATHAHGARVGESPDGPCQDEGRDEAGADEEG